MGPASSSPFSTAGFPVVAGRVGHDQNDGVGQQFSTTLEPTKHSAYNFTASFPCESAGTEGEACIKLCYKLSGRMCTFPPSTVCPPPPSIHLPTHLWMGSLLEGESIWRQGRSLSLWPHSFSPLPHYIHMHLVIFAESAVCTTIPPSFGRLVFPLFHKLLFTQK